MINKKLVVGIVLLIVAAVSATIFFNRPGQKTAVQPQKTTATEPTENIKLVYAVQWSQTHQQDGVYDANGQLVSKGINQYLQEYHALHPNVEVELQVIPYTEYADTLKVLSDADMAPDIYQIYSPWGVSYAREGILDNPPQYIKDDVKQNYVSTAGVTIDGDIWGIPTEINDYALLYNKDIFKAAGLVDGDGNILYPKTWSELVATAEKLAKRDTAGNITQYGIAFLAEDWQVVDPFLSLLFSNGGKYLSDDMTRSLFNSPEGVAALEAELALFKNGATDINGNFFDFGKGKVAMVISPPWTKSSIKEAFGDKFEATVGVAPFPPLKDQAMLDYSWFMGVMNKSAHKAEAWEFLKWLTADIQPETNTTRLGSLLAGTISAIPTRNVDFAGHKEYLGDFFTGVYVDQMKYAVAEPNVAGSSSIKAALMEEIQAAWVGNKTAAQALSDAAIKVDNILAASQK
jgi:multiple sugar transport system substrate-binding protein